MGLTYFQASQQLIDHGTSFVVVTLISARGSVPQETGAKIIVTSDGRFYGTIGGGRVEMAAITLAQEILNEQKSVPPRLVTWNLQKDIGMSCGGECTFLFEHFKQNRWPIVIFGAGHVSQALIGILKTLNCQITCVDPRPEWIKGLSGINAICHPSPKDLVKTFDPQSFFICLTMGHAYDLEILPEIYNHAPKAPYVGVIGSEVKGIRIKRELKELGVSDEFLEQLKVPMGLPLGSNEPPEIAISIAAQLLAIRGS